MMLLSSNSGNSGGLGGAKFIDQGFHVVDLYLELPLIEVASLSVPCHFEKFFFYQSILKLLES